MTERIVTELHPWERWFAWEKVRIGPFGKTGPPYTLVKGEWVERRIAYGYMGSFSYEYRKTEQGPAPWWWRLFKWIMLK